MRNVCVSLAALLLVIGAVPNRADASPVLSIQPTESIVSVGETANVSVVITDVLDLYAFQFSFVFDPAVVSVVNVSEGSFWSATGNFLPGFDTGTGAVEFIADTLNGPTGIGGSGTLAVVSLRLISPAKTALSVSDVILLDSNLGDVVAEVRSANLRVPEASSVLMTLLGLGLGAPLLGRRRAA